jgi:hypothetical protein
MSDDLPALPDKPGLLDYLEQFLPFKLPRIGLPQTAKNLDKAAARLLDAGSVNLAARMAASTARIRNRSRAEGEFIAAGSKSAVELMLGDNALAKRAIEHALGAAVLAQHNREAVLEIAAQELSQEAPHVADAVREIDDDWLNMFAELAAGKSNTDIQTLWGKILAGEIRQPGSFSLRTLAQLSTLTSDEANFIHRFMRYVIEDEFIYPGSKHEYASWNDAIRLQDLGVVAGIGGMISKQFEVRAGSKIGLRNHDLALEIASKGRALTYDVNDLFHQMENSSSCQKLCSREGDRKPPAAEPADKQKGRPNERPVPLLGCAARCPATPRLRWRRLRRWLIRRLRGRALASPPLRSTRQPSPRGRVPALVGCPSSLSPM